MKTFDTTQIGGMLLVLDDFRFMESVHKDAFMAMMKPYAALSSVIILAGCERSVNNGSISISAGWVIFEGEICRVPSQTYPEPSGGDAEYWVKEEIELTEIDSFKDFPSNPGANPVATYKENVVMIEVSDSGTYVYGSELSIKDVTFNLIQQNVATAIAQYFISNFPTNFETSLESHFAAKHYSNNIELWNDTTALNGVGGDARNLSVRESRLIEIITSVYPISAPEISYRIHTFTPSNAITFLGCHVFFVSYSGGANSSPIKMILNSTTVSTGERIIINGEDNDNELWELPYKKIVHFVKTSKGWLLQD